MTVTGWTRRGLRTFVSMEELEAFNARPRRMMQPRHMSLLESCAGTALGFGINVVAQALLFPRLGIHIPVSTNLAIALAFTALSVTRTYLLRRAFDWWHHRGRWT